MLLRDGFGAVASLAAALVPFLDGLFLFFFAIFGCSSVTALPHSTSAHVCGSRGAQACQFAIIMPSSVNALNFNPDFFRRGESGRRLRPCRPRSWSDWRKAGSALQRRKTSAIWAGLHEARSSNTPSKHCLANVFAYFAPVAVQPAPHHRSFPSGDRQSLQSEQFAASPVPRYPHGRRRGAEATRASQKHPHAEFFAGYNLQRTPHGTPARRTQKEPPGRD